MDLDELLCQVIELLQRDKRVSYRILKRRFNLDDNDLEDIKDELIHAKKLATDEDNRVLVWSFSRIFNCRLIARRLRICDTLVSL